MNALPTLFVLFLFFFHSYAQADSFITITLFNNTAYDFSFSKFETAPKNKLAMDKNLLKPKESITIKGTITADVDLRSAVYFNDDTYRFSIRVYRLKKFGQPSFMMHGARVRTRVQKDSLRFNDDGNPTHLAYIAVTVYLE